MSWPGCGGRTSNCGWSATSSLERRPGSHARPERCRPGLPVHEREPGRLPGRDNGARARRVEGRLPCLAPPSAVGPCGRDAALLKRIRTVHATSRETYGAPRVHAELRAGGERHGRKRIARLMRMAGSRRCQPPPRGVTTTRRDKDARPAPDLVDRNFMRRGPNQLWVADITFVPTASGFLYLAVVLDAWSRKIVGWSMANHLRTELVLDALEMAIGQRRPGDVIHHSDQGSQYTSLAFGKRCREAGVRPSMGSVGDAYDNAMCESFFATLECELLDRRRFASQAEARMACFSFIEGWYNPVRLHSALGYRSPMAYEAAMEVSHHGTVITQAPEHSTKTGQLQRGVEAVAWIEVVPSGCTVWRLG